MKKMLTIIVALIFTLSIISVALATGATIEGTITKIDGNKITVKDAKGKETTVVVKDLGGAKVGDTVEIKDGKVTVKKKGAAAGY